MLCVFLCCANPGTKQAKIYQGQLETMIGKTTGDLEASFKDWEFSLMFVWQEENPSVEVIKEHNRPIVEFSEVERNEIFSADASLGTIDEMGRGIMKDTAIASDRYTLIRAVFKDGIFTHFRIWGNVHQTHVSGIKTDRKRP
ncbi:MAG: hypothetical protein JSV17_18070 [Candidatus Aminicenantes bacterium]|nr:MAG: hypothetical protein JSV17_18070 [Candidatus Aminicenantes bacterium]